MAYADQEIDVSGSPTGGEFLTVTVNGNAFTYTFTKTDTTDTATHALCDAINRTAAASLGNHRACRTYTSGGSPAIIIQGALNDAPALTVSATGTTGLTVSAIGARVSP